MKVDPKLLIELILKDLNIQYVKEYKFNDERDYRFDFAIPSMKIGIEYEGGTYSGGGHVRGKHYASDCQKYNLAALSEWKVLRYTIDIQKDNAAQVYADLKFAKENKNETRNN